MKTQIEQICDEIDHDAERLKTLELEVAAIGTRFTAALAIKKQQIAMIEVAPIFKRATVTALKNSETKKTIREERRAKYPVVTCNPMPIGMLSIL